MKVLLFSLLTLVLNFLVWRFTLATKKFSELQSGAYEERLGKWLDRDSLFTVIYLRRWWGYHLHVDYLFPGLGLEKIRSRWIWNYMLFRPTDHLLSLKVKYLLGIKEGYKPTISVVRFFRKPEKMWGVNTTNDGALPKGSKYNGPLTDVRQQNRNVLEVYFEIGGRTYAGTTYVGPNPSSRTSPKR